MPANSPESSRAFGAGGAPRIPAAELLRVHHCEAALYADFARPDGARKPADTAHALTDPAVLALVEAAAAASETETEIAVHTAEGTEYYPLAHLRPLVETLTERYESLRGAWRAGVNPADMADLLTCGDCPACHALTVHEQLPAGELVPENPEDDPGPNPEDSGGTEDYGTDNSANPAHAAPFIPEQAQHPYRVRPASAAEEDDEDYAQLEYLRSRLREVEQSLPEANPTETGAREEHGSAAERARLAMLLSGVDYYRREKAPFWREHLRRLHEPYAHWAGTRNYVIFESVETATDWERVRGAKMRTLRAVAPWSDSHTLKAEDSGAYLLYHADDAPAKAREGIDSQVEAFRDTNPQARVPQQLHRLGFFGAKIISLEPYEQEGTPEENAPDTAESSGQKRMVITFTERIRVNDEEHDTFPLGLTPAAPVATRSLEAALTRTAAEAESSFPSAAPCGAQDILMRQPPRLKTRTALPRPEEFSEAELPTVCAVLAAVRDLDGSYAAVQGPPGSGKTFLGSQVIARLVAEGAKVGVVAQSHAVVENMLTACLERGLFPADHVMRTAGKSQRPDYPWREVSNRELAALLDNSGDHAPRPAAHGSGENAPAPGLLFGGTAWDFTNPKKVPEGSFDLLVIDEAGQFSLANTLAVSAAARNLLLLGDPQQLPQVTVGKHPYPLDTSALGWLSGGKPVLPEKFGYFLQLTWRMHPQLCAPVSALSYGGKLRSAPAANERILTAGAQGDSGVPAAPGLYLRRVHHEHCTVRSEVEAAAVTDLVRGFVGARWISAAGQPARTLTGEDVVVVAAYNAQVETITEHLRRAGLIDEEGRGVRVGTVDKFQGQQAPVTVLSMASSNAGAAGRGAEFLLSPNRLNVALSRGQWCSVLVACEDLHRFVPQSIPELLALGGYLGLVRSAANWQGA